MNKERFLEIIKNFKGKKIGVVGDILLDKYIYGRVERVNHERPGYPLLKVESQEFRLGGAGNVAANLISLGAKVSLYGAIGQDASGVILKKKIKKRKIKLFSVNEGETLVKQRRIEKIHKDYLGREDFGENNLKAVSKKNENKLLASIIRDKPDILILSDYNKRVFRGELGRRLILWAKKSKVQIVVDPKPINFKKFIEADVVTPNLREALEIIGREYENKSLEEIVSKLKEVMQCKYSVVTCGDKGIVSFNDSFKQMLAEAREIADVTGAGDTVVAVIALALVAGASLEEATYLANSAAGIVVGKLGTASVTPWQLINRVEEKLS